MTRTPELFKQIVIWLAIVALLPLNVWYGTSAFSPPPDWKEHTKATSKLNDKKLQASGAEKEKLEQESDQLDKKLEEAERAYYRDMFWVAFPTGLVAIVAGTFVRVQAIGVGLMLGGLFCLTSGCYSYWDRMGDWLRFGSLVAALAVVLGLGVWRFRRPAP